MQSSLSGARAVPLRVVLCSAGRGEDRTRRVLRLVRRSVVARAPGPPRETVLAARVSRFADLGDGRGCLRWLSGGFGELPGGRPSVSGESLETPGVQSMSVSKLCGSLCSGARGSEVGREQCKQSTCLSPQSSSTSGSLLCRPCQCYCRGSTFISCYWKVCVAHPPSATTCLSRRWRPLP